MEVAEVGLDSIQQKDIPFTPFIQARLIDPILDNPVEHLAHEHCHGIFEDIASDSHQRMACTQIACSIEGRFRRLHDLSLKNIQWQEQRHQFLAGSSYQKTTSSVLSAESMNDDGILTEFGGMKYYQFGVLCHFS